MRYSRIISQSLLLLHTPISQNPSPHFHSLGFKLLNTSFQSNTNFTIREREFTSSAPESNNVSSERVAAIVEELAGLTVLETADLVEVMRVKLGIDIKEMPAMVFMMPGMEFGGSGAGKGDGAAKGEEVKPEKTAFDLKLEGGFDAAVKIKIIKEVRACTDLGLKEAKDLVEKAPTLLKKGVPKEEAEKIIEKMKEVGAKVTME